MTLTTTPPALASSPANPALISRTIGGLSFTLSAEGLRIAGLASGPLALDVPAALALSDFLRSPGARTLVARAWLAEQHAQTAPIAD